MTTYIKYPRTYHLPWSHGRTDDDKVLVSTAQFEGKEVVVTEKMDGECTTFYHNHIHARSLDSANHPSRNWVKGFWSGMKNDIPLGWRICGENLYAKHSIFYKDLLSYFYGFSIWNERNEVLDWDSTLEFFALLNIIPVNEIYRGVYNEQHIIELGEHLIQSGAEGYVVRLTAQFHYNDFRVCVGKCVRKDHVQTNKHWRQQEIIPNLLRT